MNKKLTIATRYKTNEFPENYIISNGMFTLLAFGIFLFCLISNNGDLAILKYKLILASIMFLLFGILLTLEIILIKQMQDIKKSNALPEGAILMDNNYIYLNLTNEVKLSIDDIINVKSTSYKINNQTPSDSFNNGCIKIKTKGKTYTIPYLKNVTAAANQLKALKKYTPLHFGDVTFLFNGNEYSTEFELDGIKFSIDLSVDQGYYEQSVETFKQMQPSLKELYQKIIKRTAKDMVELANDWRSDDDDHEITRKEIEKRIDKKSLYIDLVGNSYMIYYTTDGLFTDHDFQYCGDPNSEEYSVDIVG